MNICNGDTGEVKLTTKDVLHIANSWIDCVDILGQPQDGKVLDRIERYSLSYNFNE